MSNEQFFYYIVVRTSYILMRGWWCPLCTIPTFLDFHSASSLKQHSAGRHVAPPGHIILIPNKSVFAVTPWYCKSSGEAANTNFIVFGLIRPGIEPTIYRTQGEHANHRTTDAVVKRKLLSLRGNLHIETGPSFSNAGTTPPKKAISSYIDQSKYTIRHWDGTVKLTSGHLAAAFNTQQINRSGRLSPVTRQKFPNPL
jgi:hypothetical protein